VSHDDEPQLLNAERLITLEHHEAAARVDEGDPTKTALVVEEKRSAGKEWNVPKNRVLVGIFSGDFKYEKSFRNKFRHLFGLYPSRICFLEDFMSQWYAHDTTKTCELVYTFVIGSNPNASTQLVDHSRPMLVEQYPVPTNYSSMTEYNKKDMTHLNIKENMEDGKSQTWITYALSVAEKYDIAYIAKQDTDSMPYLDKFFDFVDRSLPPFPFNRNILASHFTAKSWGKSSLYVANRYGVLSENYGEGQFYLMSTDVARTVQETAQTDRTISEELEHIEDYDVSLMAYRHKDPLTLILIDNKDNKFWKHGVNIGKLMNRKQFHLLWDNESRRIENNNANFSAPVEMRKT
jgi:hypothetical protein